jgi:hypothetical protein
MFIFNSCFSYINLAKKYFRVSKIQIIISFFMEINKIKKMNHSYHLIIAVFILTLVCISGVNSKNAIKNSFQWGVTGHPVSTPGYRDIGVSKQLDLISELGAGWYRFDILQSSFEKNQENLDRFISEAVKRKIKLLAVLIPNSILERGNETPQQIYSSSKTFAKAVVTRYKQVIDEWELDNELFSYALVKKGEKTSAGKIWQWGSPGGSSPDDYENRRFEQTKSNIYGLYEGAKSADPKSITVVCDGWLHYGYIERLLKETDSLPFDKLAWHWYSEMGDITNVGGKLNVIDHLHRFGKPLLITEMNRRNGSMGGKEDEQAQYITKEVRRVANNSKIEGLFIYELLDEPYFGIKNGESYYGLVKISKNNLGMWQLSKKKRAFSAYKNVINSNRNNSLK